MAKSKSVELDQHKWSDDLDRESDSDAGGQKSQDLTYVMGREWPRPPTTMTMTSRAFGHGTSNASNTEMEDDVTGERRSTIRLVGYSAASDDLTPPSKQAYIKQRARKRNRENALFAAGPSARLSSLSKIGRPRMMVPKAVSRQSVSSAYSQPLEEEGSVRRKSTQQAVPLRHLSRHHRTRRPKYHYLFPLALHEHHLRLEAKANLVLPLQRERF